MGKKHLQEPTVETQPESMDSLEQKGLQADKNGGPHWPDKIIAVFTILTFLTYIASNFFLWQQLKLTQDAVRASEAQFRLANRPWVNIEAHPEIVEPLVIRGLTAHMKLKCSLKNAGTSPALGVLIGSAIKIETLGQLMQENLSCDVSLMNRLSAQHGLLILPQSTREQRVDVVTNNNVAPGSKTPAGAFLVMSLYYHDQLGDAHCTSLVEQYLSAEDRPVQLEQDRPIAGHLISFGLGHAN